MISADIPNSAFEGGADTDTATTEAVKFSMQVTLDGFNEPVAVEAPAESVSVLELLAPLMGGMMGGGAFAQ
jgi:hypothetical protein